MTNELNVIPAQNTTTDLIDFEAEFNRIANEVQGALALSSPRCATATT